MSAIESSSEPDPVQWVEGYLSKERRPYKKVINRLKWITQPYREKLQQQVGANISQLQIRSRRWRAPYLAFFLATAATAYFGHNDLDSWNREINQIIDSAHPDISSQTIASLQNRLFYNPGGFVMEKAGRDQLKKSLDDKTADREDQIRRMRSTDPNRNYFDWMMMASVLPGILVAIKGLTRKSPTKPDDRNLALA